MHPRIKRISHLQPYSDYQEHSAVTENQETTTTISLELESNYKLASLIMGYILIFLSLVNLTGWICGINWLEPPFVGIVSLKISGAIGFLLGGISLVCRWASKEWQTVGIICATAMLAFVLTILSSYINATTFLTKDIIAKLIQTTGLPASTILITPAVTVLYAWGAVGLLLSHRGKQDLPAIIVLISGSLSFFTRLFGVKVFHEHYGLGLGAISNYGTDTYLSYLACSMLTILGLAILFSNPRYSMLGLLCSTSRGGYLTRRILPPAIAVPLCWAALATAGEYAHLYNQSVRWTLFINGTIASFCFMSCNIAKRLDVIDQSRIALAEKRADTIYSLAHDLKVPLIGAIQSLDLLLKGALGQLQTGQRNLLAVLRESMSEQVWMIDNLVYEYQNEQEKEDLNLNICLIDKLLDDCLEKLLPAFQVKNIEIDVNHATPNASISADSTAMRRVINNLLHNALKHCPRDGQVQIRSGFSDQKYTFTIWNSGPIISDSEKNHLFERFWQSEDTYNRHVGNGLGLYICRQIVEAHNGQISCQSERSEGTALTVDLPTATVA